MKSKQHLDKPINLACVGTKLFETLCVTVWQIGKNGDQIAFDQCMEQNCYPKSTKKRIHLIPAEQKVEAPETAEIEVYRNLLRASQDPGNNPVFT